MSVRFPSSEQQRYTQSVIPLPLDLTLQILSEADDETFDRLCSQPEFSSVCSQNSAFSERLYEERSKGKFTDLIKFKPREMTWREFYTRMKHFVNSYVHSNEFASKGKLMELQIVYETVGELPDQDGANWAAANGQLNVLEFIYEHPPHTLPDINGANLAAKKGKLDALKFIYEKGGILPDASGINDAYIHNHDDVVDWINSKINR